MGVGKTLFKFVFNKFKSKNRTTMVVWCLKDNEPAKKFYLKMSGKIQKEKLVKIGEKEYQEVGFIYNF